MKDDLPACRRLLPNHFGPETSAIAELAIADPRAFELLGQGPQTLLHGDLHVQNSMFRAEEARAIDWQTCFRGNPMTAVARLLMSSLDTNDRRSLSERFMKGHCEALTSEGVEGYGVDRAADDLAVGLIHNGMVYVLSMPIIDLESMIARKQRPGCRCSMRRSPSWSQRWTITTRSRWSRVALTPRDKREKGDRTLRPLHEAQPDTRRAMLGTQIRTIGSGNVSPRE